MCVVCLVHWYLASMCRRSGLRCALFPCQEFGACSWMSTKAKPKILIMSYTTFRMHKAEVYKAQLGH